MATETKENKKEDFKNDLVHVIVNRKPNCIVEYEVEVFPQICTEARQKAAKNVGKDVTVPGFRKGKAPAEIVSKRYPHELDKRWQEDIANIAYQEAAKLAQVPIVRKDASITFNMHSHSRDGAKLTLSFETIPAIPSVDPAKCVLGEVKRPETSKEKVEETIRQTQMFFGKWETVPERPIKEGDFLLLDVEITENDPPQMLFANTRFEVADKSMAQWMKALVIGKKPGDVVEGVSEPDPDLSEEEKKEYPPKKVRVTIKAIEETKLPELDDAFAKQLGAENVSELHEKIEKLLTKKADEHVRELQREQVTKLLLSHPFEIPSSIIEKEVQFRLQQMMQDPKFKTDWDKSSDQEKRDLIQNVKEQAEKAVRIFYLCRKISADQNIEVQPADVAQGAPDVLESLLFPSAERHDPRQPDVKQAEAYSRVLLEKTEDWVIAHARTQPASKEKADSDGEIEQKETSKKSAPKKAAAKKTAPKKKAAPKKAAAKKTAPKKTKPKDTKPKN